jgi:CHAD domain-containing protein
MNATTERQDGEGLAYWMRAVLDERRKVLETPTPDAVHDLRVAVRRCRSMAEGMMDLDQPDEWRKLRRQGRDAFRALGELRDTQVMLEWVGRLADAADPVRQALEELLRKREAEELAAAQSGLRDFRTGRWKAWLAELPARAERVAPGSPVFAHMALERWREAHALHNAALRTGTPEGYHSLRVGIKRFRYTVENFLPERYADWEKGLKELQDLLGEAHDLDVLEDLLPEAGEAYDEAEQARWTERIRKDRSRRLDTYRRRTTGAKSLWEQWRRGLPARNDLTEAAVAKLEAWAMFRDDDFERTREAARRALEAFDTLRACTSLLDEAPPTTRRLLRVAALLRNAAKPREVETLPLPVGWTRPQMVTVAAILRSAKKGDSKKLEAFPPAERETIVLLSSLLRMGEAATGQEAEG